MRGAFHLNAALACTFAAGARNVNGVTQAMRDVAKPLQDQGCKFA
jgi:hypothetical protein